MSQGAAPGLGAARPGWRGAQTDAFIRVNAGQLITAARTYRDVAMEIELKGGRPQAAAAAGGGRRGLQPRARRRGGRCRLAPEGQPARRGQRRHGARGRSPGGAARHPRSLSPRRQAGPGHGAAAARRIDGVRRPHADLCRSGARRRGQRGRREAQRPLRRRRGRLALGPGRRDGRRRGQRRPGDRHAAGPGRVHGPRRQSGLGARGSQGHRRAERGAGVARLGGGRRSRARLPGTADRRGDAATPRAGDLDIRAADGARIGRAHGSGAAAAARRPAHCRLAQILDRRGTRSRSTGWRSTSPAATSKDSSRSPPPATGAGSRRASMSTSSRSPECSASLHDQRLAVAAAAETAVSGRQSVWSDEPFDAAVLDGFEGNVTLTAKRLVLAEGIGLSQASIDIALAGRQGRREAARGCLPRRALQRDAEHRQGAGRRGRQRQPARGGRRARSLWPASAGGKPRASGTIGGEIKFSGKGIEPAQRALRAAGQRHARARRRQARHAVAGRHRPGGRGGAQVGPRQPARSPQADRSPQALPAASCRCRARSASRSPTGGSQPSRSSSTPPRGARKARRASTSRRCWSSPIGGWSRSPPVPPTRRPCRQSR